MYEASAVICGVQPTDKAWYSDQQAAPFFDSLGTVHYPITTNNQTLQRYFDQGLTLAYGFNHAEAARSFYQAIRLDSTSAMAHWGFSYVLGPNYNAGMEPDNYQRAYQAIQKAIRYSQACTEKEKSLIHALAKRYPASPVNDRRPYDVAYANAMKAVRDRFLDDVDIGALYAESLMDLHPWDLWTKSGQPKPWTPEIVAVLEQTMQRSPKHTGANHFYIHAVEASQTPQRGLASAALLTQISPGSGHLAHMPSHIYIRTGQYHQGSQSNIQAVRADSTYLTACHAQGAYPLMYYPHNYHFLAATAALEGNSALALNAARKVAENTKRSLLNQPGWSTLQHYYTIPYYVAIKFRKWDDILHWSQIDTLSLKYPSAIRHYARGMAYAGKQQLAQAKAELKQVEAYASDSIMAKQTFWGINSGAPLVQIASRVLKAEILAQEGQPIASVALLREAVRREDQLNYNEPPDWLFSVRHQLGDMLLKAKQWRAAEQVFTEDLQTLPENGWALAGLAKAQQAQNKPASARQTKNRALQAWRWADRQLVNSIR
ncbi:hypothetical protein HNV11_02990 [Spirosoma taeanense]|uniref:Tetratricopeptide repeat protein n=1 Tax=Spirosoma taeanense TaxID=2735870 RepID=A0A6M5YDU5_9BACT|nr:hypothetical protein HNV11_02990 [Spirosoma taeanense]